MRSAAFFLLVSLLGHLALRGWLLRVTAWRWLRDRRGMVALAAACVVPAALRGAAAVSAAPWIRALCEVFALETFVAIVAAPIVLVLNWRMSRAAPAADREAQSRPAQPVLNKVQDAHEPGAPPAAETIPEASADPAPVTGRRAVLRLAQAGVAVYGGLGFLSIYGDRKARFDFAIEEVVVPIVGLSKAMDGYTIVQISDIHTGVFVGESELRRGLALIAPLRPDLLVATGDIVDIDPERAPLFGRMFADVSARDGHYCIVGNHDHYAGVAAVEAHLRRAGLGVLTNEARPIRTAEGGFTLVGVDDLYGLRSANRGPDFWGALRRLPNPADRERPRILLAHQPKFVNWVAGSAALQLSGHTHGGQINAGLRPADLLMRYVAGRYEVSGTTLWVNRGYGVAGPPVRLGAPPEITKIVLVAA